jgi:RimJ/RimL family protein N-acetyltransferase
VIYRRAAKADLELVMPLFVADPACDMAPELFATRISSGEYRPERTWIAQEDAASPPLAVAVWWAHPDQLRPAALDALFVADSIGSPAARTAIASGLLDAAHLAFRAEGRPKPPEYHIFLPSDWRDWPAVLASLAWRLDAARRSGLGASLERLRYEWTPSAGLPDPPSRLLFRPEPDDDVFIDLFRRVLNGTLDQTSKRETELIGAQAQARKDVAFYRDQMHGDRAWWRVACTPAGELAGFGIPSRNTEHPVVGYLGVLPEHRGHGYVDEILAEVTRTLTVQARASTIHADTDLGNQPMAASFERAGYRNFGRRLVLSATDGAPGPA